MEETGSKTDDEAFVANSVVFEISRHKDGRDTGAAEGMSERWLTANVDTCYVGLSSTRGYAMGSNRYDTDVFTDMKLAAGKDQEDFSERGKLGDCLASQRMGPELEAWRKVGRAMKSIHGNLLEAPLNLKSFVSCQIPLERLTSKHSVAYWPRAVAGEGANNCVVAADYCTRVRPQQG